MTRWKGTRLPRLSVLTRALVATVGVVALLGGAVGAAAGVGVSPDIASNSVYVPLAPSRVLDTRSGNGLSSGALTPHVPQTLQVANRFPSDPSVNVPSSATAVTGNLTVTGATLQGYVALTPIQVAYPGTSTINFGANQDVANGVTVPLGTGGVICLTYVAKPGGRVDVILDITGYFVPSSGGGTGPEGPAGPSGAPGATGVPGTDGKTVLNGSGAPASGLGSNGDFYIDTTNNAVYGPKTSGGWGSATSLVGPSGAPGATGIPGTDGKTVLNGSGAPSDSLGANGDFYIDTTANKIYGPKATGAWPLTGTSLVGPTFANYRAGAVGIGSTTSSASVTFDAVPNANYSVSLTFEGTPVPKVGFLECTNKTTTGFTVSIVDASGVPVPQDIGGAIIDWVLIPYAGVSI